MALSAGAGAAVFDPALYPREYRVAPLMRGFCAAAGGLVMVGSFMLTTVFTAQIGAKTNAPVIDVFALCFFLFGLWLATWPFLQRIVLTASALELHGLLGKRTLPRAEIVGRRTVSGRYGKYTDLYLRSSEGHSVRLPNGLATDAAFQQWVMSLTDLDAQDATQSLTAVEADPDIGRTVEEREARLTWAKRTWQIYFFALLGAILALLLPLGEATHAGAIALLAALPWFAFALMAWRPHLYVFDGRRRDVRPDYWLPFIFIAGALLFAAVVDYDLVDLRAMARPLVNLAVLVAAVAILVTARVGTHLRTYIFLVLWVAAYSAGAVIEANGLLDAAPPHVYSAQVLGKSITHGRRSTYYHLALSGWGGRRNGNSVAVSRSFYNSVEPRRWICVEVRPGALAIPWYLLTNCR